MSHTYLDTEFAPGISVPLRSRLLSWAARGAARLRAELELARTRRVVRSLDERQLADAGIDASKILPPRPTFEIEAGLMTRLMSMR